MNILSRLFDLVSFAGAAQGVLLASFMFSRRNGNTAVGFLAAYVMIFSLGLLEPFAINTLDGVLRIPVLSLLAASNFLYGPLLYFFVLNLGTNGHAGAKRFIAHSALFLVIFVSETALSYLQVSPTLHDTILLIAFEGLVIHILGYNVRAIGLLRRFLTTEGETGIANLSVANARWLQSLLIFITAIYVVSFSISHLKLFGIASADNYYLVVQLLIALMIYMMTYRLILQPDILLPGSSILREATNGGMLKYARSGLKEDQASRYAEMLKNCMDREKPYLDPDISIHTLAQKIGISKNHLTQVLNERLKVNFYEYINGRRVDEAKKMICSPAYNHLTLTGIGLEAGFKSKTAFNQNFKKVTGCTPTEWKRKAMGESVVNMKGGAERFDILSDPPG